MVNGDDYFSWNTEGSASKKKKKWGKRIWGWGYSACQSSEVGERTISGTKQKLMWLECKEGRRAGGWGEAGEESESSWCTLCRTVEHFCLDPKSKGANKGSSEDWPYHICISINEAAFEVIFEVSKMTDQVDSMYMGLNLIGGFWARHFKVWLIYN